MKSLKNIIKQPVQSVQKQSGELLIIILTLNISTKRKQRMNTKNISPDWKGSTRQERRIIQSIKKRDSKPSAITYFAKHCSVLGDYWYWFMLSTLWVSYSGWSDLNLWKKLLSSKRPNRKTSIMKPDELECFNGFPDEIKAYRAHRENEKDWISYTTDPYTASKFAAKRDVNKITEYKLNKSDIIAFFLRRGEHELIMPFKNKAVMVRDIEVIIK